MQLTIEVDIKPPTLGINIKSSEAWSVRIDNREPKPLETLAHFLEDLTYSECSAGDPSKPVRSLNRRRKLFVQTSAAVKSVGTLKSREYKNKVKNKPKE